MRKFLFPQQFLHQNLEPNIHVGRGRFEYFHDLLTLVCSQCRSFHVWPLSPVGPERVFNRGWSAFTTMLIFGRKSASYCTHKAATAAICIQHIPNSLTHQSSNILNAFKDHKSIYAKKLQLSCIKLARYT